MPLKEIRKKFTYSELAILAWRSQEQRIQMHRRIHGDEEPQRQYEDEPQSLEDIPEDVIRGKKKVVKEKLKVVTTRSGKKRKDYGGAIPANLPDRFFDENGDLNLSRVTGEEAYKFFAAQGIKLPVMPRSR